ncbi:hypothetical protein [Sulfurisphaera ohwakuensis]|uniref:Uncharacterized protein n=1 Tax=Sulfurisphaera ohwakuensis TaxID=69656 RepID=A0A650CEX3_SULOH|nr:hypothetical protein [Sulfurisphaera ohwakuensis]MBB5252760.1 hypothetical protein [Sulfurisphaera ohwakuensis]QGR16298.1 hypothetical protein D1869_03090 [Sulfurisphaera ohwakuensis]
MRRFYYYFIPIILLLIILLGLYYPQLNITIQQALTTANTIKIFLYSHHKLITNASISVFAFYPTSNGTTFQKIYNASNKQYYQFPVKKLDKWAEQWIKFNKKEKTIIYPSILILATYSIINQTTIITLTQTYATPLNITQIINGQGGKNIIIKFKTPIKHKIKLKNNKNQKIVQQTTTTTITSKTNGGYVITEYIPNIIGWYPNNKSVGPIAIATIIGPQNNLNYYESTLGVIVSNQQGYSVSIGFYISQPLLGQLPIRVTIPGPSLTVCDSNSIVEAYNTTEIGTPSPYDVGQLYVLGQVAWVNWTEIYYIPHDSIYQVYHFLQVILTEIVSVENGNAVAPKIYYYNSYIPNTSYNELPRNSYSTIKPFIFYSPGGGRGCIAPVYFNNLTYLGSSSGEQVFSYGSMYIHGINSQFQVGLNVGALATLVMPEASPAFTAELGMVNIGVSISSSQISSSALILGVRNELATPLNVYYSNYSALYDINGQYYIIPTGVFYLNYS